MESCQFIKGSGAYQWVGVPGIIYTNTTFTVAAGDCPELKELLIRLQKFIINPAVTVTINLPDGTYSCSSALNVERGHFINVYIIGNTTTPANVSLQFSGSNGFYLNHGALGLLNGVKIEGIGSTPNVTGLVAEGNSKVVLGQKIIFDGWDGSAAAAIRVLSGSHVGHSNWLATSGDHGVVTNSERGVVVDSGSSAALPFIEITGLGSTTGYGILASGNSAIYASGAVISSVNIGVEASRRSAINVPNSNLSNVTHGVIAHLGGLVEAQSSSASSCTNTFYAANFQGAIIANSSTAVCFNNGTSRGYSATQGSYIYAYGAAAPTNCGGGNYAPSVDVNNTAGSVIGQPP